MPLSNYEKALDQALQSAYEALSRKDLKETAFRSGASCKDDAHLRLPYLNRTLDVAADSKRIETDAGPVDRRTAILALHYLLRASGSPLTGRMIGFKEVPQGSLYFEPFRNRVLMPMSRILEGNPEAFETAAEQLGGEQVRTADLSFRFRVFPYVTSQYVWYKAEEGIPSDLNILFDASIPEYLATEDIVVMCEETNRNLKSMLPQNARNHKKDGR